MKVTESWLREWVNPKQDITAITDLLSLSGLEVDALHTLDAKDHLIDINITPNRGDCLSVNGIARELAALSKVALIPPKIAPTPVTINEAIAVDLQSTDCPLYLGRVISGIDNTRPTPAYITDRLQHLGVRSISLVVDIANYVMLELGQPLHAFDLAKMGKKIIVRDAKEGETLILLDESTASPDSRTLVIADDENLLALAGVMGGLDSGVSLDTTAIFLESAHFLAQRIAGKTRLFGINSDAAYRFERGVDPKLVALAIERASSLILEYAGGSAGPITQAGQMPAQKNSITLRLNKINRILGMDFPKNEVAPILGRLGFEVSEGADWQVIAPSYRFDIALEVDLIEELARVYGYQHIPTTAPTLALAALPVPEHILTADQLRQLCVGRGYHELMTYSFVDGAAQASLLGKSNALMLLNPMSSQMDAMRQSLLPGLLQALCYNQNRQQAQMRLFEIGLCFLPEDGHLNQQQYIAGVLSSQQPDKHWQLLRRDANFYDIKGDVEALLALTGRADEFSWQAGKHPALHPGQSAYLMYKGENLGFLGQLHPGIAKQLDIKGKVFIFELQLAGLLNSKTPAYAGISKFPSIRRDLALVVDKSVAAQDLCKVVAQQTPLLQEIKIFDVYEGAGIAPDKKSIAMGIVLQARDRTLADTEINALMQQVIKALEQTYQATIRD